MKTKQFKVTALREMDMVYYKTQKGFAIDFVRKNQITPVPKVEGYLGKSLEKVRNEDILRVDRAGEKLYDLSKGAFKYTDILKAREALLEMIRGSHSKPVFFVTPLKELFGNNDLQVFHRVMAAETPAIKSNIRDFMRSVHFRCDSKAEELLLAGRTKITIDAFVNECYEEMLSEFKMQEANVKKLLTHEGKTVMLGGKPVFE